MNYKLFFFSPSQLLLEHVSVPLHPGLTVTACCLSAVPPEHRPAHLFLGGTGATPWVALVR